MATWLRFGLAASQLFHQRADQGVLNSVEMSQLSGYILCYSQFEQGTTGLGLPDCNY